MLEYPLSPAPVSECAAMTENLKVNRYTKSSKLTKVGSLSRKMRMETPPTPDI